MGEGLVLMEWKGVVMFLFLFIIKDLEVMRYFRFLESQRYGQEYLLLCLEGGVFNFVRFYDIFFWIF